ncbi:MAG TPA: hypothetical protein VHF51_06125 [Solirubrobacteraceae bacterium]|nr:hypothetical protein [Solirubrobacteraceae bacterium]
MARRSRKARPGGGAERARRGYARSEERNEALRAGLTPLAPGERPLALTVAALLAAALAVVNLGALVLGVEVDGRRPSTVAVLLFGAVMLGAAWGLWHRRYWAVLGFEALLGVTLAFAGLSLMVASNVAALVLCVGILLGGGWLFWKLIRVMGRLQAPPRPG